LDAAFAAQNLQYFFSVFVFGKAIVKRIFLSLFCVQPPPAAAEKTSLFQQFFLILTKKE